MRTPRTNPNTDPNGTASKLRNRSHQRHHEHVEGGAIAVAIPHGRYTVAFHLEPCQMWVLDTGGHDTPRGPYLSTRQAWMIANELNTGDQTGHTDNAGHTAPGRGGV